MIGTTERFEGWNIHRLVAADRTILGDTSKSVENELSDVQNGIIEKTNDVFTNIRLQHTEDLISAKTILENVSWIRIMMRLTEVYFEIFIALFDVE